MCLFTCSPNWGRPSPDQGMQAAAVFEQGEAKPVMVMVNIPGLRHCHTERWDCDASSTWRQRTLLTLPGSPVATIIMTYICYWAIVGRCRSNQNISPSLAIIPLHSDAVLYLVPSKTNLNYFLYYLQLFLLLNICGYLQSDVTEHSTDVIHHTLPNIRHLVQVQLHPNNMDGNRSSLSRSRKFLIHSRKERKNIPPRIKQLLPLQMTFLCQDLWKISDS
jgi:hypothetical protein